MHSTDIKLFGEILEEVSTEKYDEAISSMDDARCSEKHYRRMIKILGIEVEPYIPHHKWRLRTQILAIIITIMIVLTGCAAAVIMINEEIREAIIEWYDTHIKIGYDDNASPDRMNAIEDFYMPEYIPSGYKKTDEFTNPILAIHEWENEAGDIIVFRQSTVGNSDLIVDNEQGTLEHIEYNRYEIQFHMAEHSYQYIWNDGKYFFTITSSENLTQEEIIKIIEGLQCESVLHN